MPDLILEWKTPIFTSIFFITLKPEFSSYSWKKEGKPQKKKKQERKTAPMAFTFAFTFIIQLHLRLRRSRLTWVPQVLHRLEQQVSSLIIDTLPPPSFSIHSWEVARCWFTLDSICVVIVSCSLSSSCQHHCCLLALARHLHMPTSSPWDSPFVELIVSQITCKDK